MDNAYHQAEILAANSGMPTGDRETFRGICESAEAAPTAEPVASAPQPTPTATALRHAPAIKRTDGPAALLLDDGSTLKIDMLQPVFGYATDAALKCDKAQAGHLDIWPYFAAVRLRVHAGELKSAAFNAATLTLKLTNGPDAQWDFDYSPGGNVLPGYAPDDMNRCMVKALKLGPAPRTTIRRGQETVFTYVVLLTLGQQHGSLQIENSDDSQTQDMSPRPAEIVTFTF